MDIRERNRNKFINEVIAIHGDICDYSDINYIDRKTLIKIKCKKHGIFEQTPNSHYKTIACKGCKLDILQEKYIIDIYNCKFSS